MWLGDRDRLTAVIHGKWAVVMLCNRWAWQWKEEGECYWAGDRMVAMVCNSMRLIAYYQPIWGTATVDELCTCRAGMEEQLMLARTRKQTVLIGDNFNASMVRRWQKCNRFQGQYGIGSVTDIR